jgi:ribosome-associated protein
MENHHSSQYLATIRKILEDGKAEDIQAIDVRGITDLADFMVIASGTSSRHISSLADKISDAIKLLGAQHIGIEGQAVGKWVLVDTHEVVVHLLQKETREEYQLEDLYRAAKFIS